jgi:hypothetical protein
LRSFRKFRRKTETKSRMLSSIAPLSAAKSSRQVSEATLTSFANRTRTTIQAKALGLSQPPKNFRKATVPAPKKQPTKSFNFLTT